MKRLGIVLFVCIGVVSLSFFFSRERDLARRSGSEATGPGGPGVAADKFLVSGIAKRKSGGTGGSGGDGDIITTSDLAKAETLEQILKSKNDNDPRLDRDFNGLTAGAKRLLRDRYARFSPERRNERGTIVFLLGRNLSSGSDVEFLHSVLSEDACRSLADCSKDAAGVTSPENLHHEMGGDVTLAYPQLVALKSIERLLSAQNAGAAGSGDASVLAAARNELEAARHSPVAKVAALAEDILAHLKR